MDCCDNHDHLDRTLHTDEYLGNICGTPKYVLKKDSQGNPISRATAETPTRPAYCCPDCPTLIAAHRALP